MKLLLRSVRPYLGAFLMAIFLKFLGTASELLLPYILEHMVDHVVPTKNLTMVILWGLLMFVSALLCRQFNVMANRKAIFNAHNVSYDVRQALFEKTANLSGKQFDDFGLPSLISRMTSDSYNVQQVVQQFQTLCVRAPIMLLGGVFFTLSMDWRLAMILVCMIPFLLAVVLFVSSRGIPLFTKVQQKLDTVVRIMRENITGIRVVKALSKEPYEMRRFEAANDTTAKRDIRAGVTMALPGPIVTLFLNVGLTLVVLIGARRVNAGETQPGVILAFLTYFNMILMGVMGLNRVFMMLSKANASAARIAGVAQLPEDLPVLPEGEGAKTDREGYIVFDHVSFSYAGKEGGAADASAFAGASRQQCLKNIDFAIRRGFYDADEGHVFVDGKDVRTWDRDGLHRLFGAVFQNDAIFADTIRENVVFGRDVDEEGLEAALEDAKAAEFVRAYEDGADHMAAIHGGNFSGGQKQRLLIARALAARPEILILDDASSALDYRTDAELRRAIREHHGDATLIVIAQRVSSIMNLDQIIVLDEGEMIGRGTHEELLRDCPVYREIQQTQMGEVS